MLTPGEGGRRADFDRFRVARAAYTVLADLVYSAVNEDSLMTEKLRRRGLHVGRHYGVDPFTSATAS